jgi:serine protease AprX
MSVTLVVQAPAPDFTLGASPASRTVARGGSTTYAVTITKVNGFSGSVSLSVSGLPQKTSASFNPNPATSSSTLTVTTSKKTSRGTSTLTIRERAAG